MFKPLSMSLKIHKLCVCTHICTQTIFFLNLKWYHINHEFFWHISILTTMSSRCFQVNTDITTSFCEQLHRNYSSSNEYFVFSYFSPQQVTSSHKYMCVYRQTCLYLCTCVKNISTWKMDRNGNLAIPPLELCPK